MNMSNIHTVKCMIFLQEFSFLTTILQKICREIVYLKDKKQTFEKHTHPCAIDHITAHFV